MSLVTGSHVGPYEIVALLGAGGMGEVYRARDAKLGRDVAIKILPDALARDPDRRVRFEREAKTLAALNHPHIAQIYGFEETAPTSAGQMAGAGALVMELVDGPTLAERIAQSGRLPIDEAVAIARQIAVALEAAHDQGIIHRDLKPANIKIRHDGTVKVLDFGLAKALDPLGASSSADISAMNSPTQTARATLAGIVLGTAAYSAPEQARGKPVDRRADVWAFGAVLYEMLTGRRAFRGEDGSDTLASVLKQDPDWSALPPRVPPSIRRLLRRSLVKDPRARLSAMGDARLELDEWEAADVEPPTRPRPANRILWGALAASSAIALIAVIALAILSRRTPAAPALSRFSFPPSAGTTLFPDSTAVAISPDGRYVALVTGDVAAAFPPTLTGLWIRALDSLDARFLPGTEGAVFPFWSPDSRQVAFFANRQLKKVTLADGHIDEICDAPDPRGGSWSRSNVIVFSPLNAGPLMRVNAAGGKPEPVTALDANEHGHRFPAFLEDGDHFVYASVPPHNGEFNILLGSLSGLDRTSLLTAQNAPAVASGHLLFMRRGSLVAQKFDPKRLTLVGDSLSLSDAPRDIGVYALAGTAVSASRDGSLAYYTHPPGNSKLVWFDRSGKQQTTVSMPAGTYIDVGLAPNLGRAAVVKQVSPATTELWVVDLERGGASRLANAPGQNSRPVFSPDSERVAFSSDRDGPRDMYMIPAQGSPPEQPIYRSKTLAKDPLSWSPDGRFLVYRDVGPSTSWDLWTRPTSGDGSPTAYAQGPSTETNGAISPDGRWMVYTSDETGRNEVYVQDFPVPKRKYRVTSNGGARAWWRADGRQLLILNADWTQLLAADVRPGPVFTTEVPQPVGQLPKGIVALDVAPDATRVLAVLNDGSDGARSATVVLNWAAALEKR
jgi:serine/threonine protein kinase/Tol biopolymer transport system component